METAVGTISYSSQLSFPSVPLNDNANKPANPDISGRSGSAVHECQRAKRSPYNAVIHWILPTSEKHLAAGHTVFVILTEEQLAGTPFVRFPSASVLGSLLL